MTLYQAPIVHRRSSPTPRSRCSISARFWPACPERIATSRRESITRPSMSDFISSVTMASASALIDDTFAAAARFHALPIDQKLALRINHHMGGYLPIGGAKNAQLSRQQQYAPRSEQRPFFACAANARPSDPDVVSGKPWRGLNQWPAGLPEFRETVLTYWRRMEALGQSMLPLYDIALDMPAGFFRSRFEGAHINLRLVTLSAPISRPRPTSLRHRAPHRQRLLHLPSAIRHCWA